MRRAAAPPARGGGVEAEPALLTLFRVRFTHAYYNDAGERCPDLGVIPTAATAALMRATGLMLRDDGHGFTILIPATRRAALVDALARSDPPRLTLLLRLRNPDFIGFTALPIATTPMRDAIRATNLVTDGSGLARLFGTGAAIGAGDLAPVTGPSLALPMRRAGRVTVRDVAGRAVAETVATADDTAAVSLAALPYGTYAIASIPARAYAGPPIVAWLPPAAGPAGLIELLPIAPADTGAADAFPIAADDTITPVDLTLHFASRATYWRYYVVTGDPAGSDDDLAITGEGASHGMRFARSPALLPNGDRATVFAAAEPLPMHRRPTARYALTGTRGARQGRSGDIRIPRLAAAPAAPVWPAPREPLAGTSEIFVYL